MSQPSEPRRRRRNNELIDSAEDLAAGVGRLGYGLLSLGLGLLPGQTRTHMHRALRELSYAFVELPGTFAEIAGDAIEQWAADSDGPAAGTAASTALGAAAAPPADAAASTSPPAAGAARPVQRLRVVDAGPEPAAPPPPPAPVAHGAAPVAIAHIEYDPPGRDVDGEYVLLRNATAAAVNLTGWTLHDGKANHVYTFPAFSLAAGAEARLWTKVGADDAANLYWGERSAVWNNDGDTGTLKDAAGAVVSSFTYAGSKRR